jgi:S-DNA-T family DNA segregation ATPase FtsK/SpoIIIE
MTTTTHGCRGCGEPVPQGRAWHRDCLAAYRASTDYRTIALTRDGFNCARCPTWWNRLVLAHPDRRLGQPGAAARRFLPGARKVDVDHIDPIGGTGTHARTNLQVLCRGLPFRHHKRKTRLDIARLKGIRPRRSALAIAARRAAVLTALLAAAVAAKHQLLHAPDPADRADLAAAAVTWAKWTIAAAVTVVAWLKWREWRGRIVDGLWRSLLRETGDSDGLQGKQLRARRWRWQRAIHRPAPTWVRLTYPPDCPDHDPDWQQRVEDRTRTRLGWATLRSEWDTAWSTVTMQTPDPFVTAAPEPWPVIAEHGPRSIWQPIPLMRDPKGRTISATLIERNLLIGGEPGAGKSNAAAMPLAAAALDPTVRLYLVDGKKVEFGRWREVADRMVFTAAALDQLLKELIEIMDLRYDLLEAEGRVKVEQDDGTEIICVFVDELAFFTMGGAKAARDARNELLRDLISRGRAAGIIVVLATQRPSADVVPTMIRDIVGYRWALRCTTPASSDMVLGAGSASAGFTASRIDPLARGAGYLLAEGGRPQLGRAFLVDPAAVEQLVDRAKRVRGLTADEPAEPEVSGPTGGPVDPLAKRDGEAA